MKLEPATAAGVYEVSAGFRVRATRIGRGMLFREDPAFESESGVRGPVRAPSPLTACVAYTTRVDIAP